MIFNKLTNFLGPKVYSLGFSLKNRTPEIYLVAGIGAGIASAIWLAKAHKKSEETFDDVAQEIYEVNELYSGGTRPRDKAQMLLPLYTEVAVRAIKLYAPPVLLGVSGVALVMASHGVLKGREKALLGGLAMFQQGFSEYRKRVVGEYGVEAEERLYYGLEPRKVVTLEKTDNGKSKKRKTVQNHIPDEPAPIMYQRVFAEGRHGWSVDPSLTEFFIQTQENHLNEKLRWRETVLLNDAYEMLGFSPTPYGCLVGWSTKAPGDDRIDFGLGLDVNQRMPENRFMLDFNVNGEVWMHVGNGLEN